MGNAIWLFISLPHWYFASVLNPIGAGPLTLIPAVGVFCLGGGIVSGLIRKRWEVLLFLVSPGVSQAYVTLAGFLRGAFPQGNLSLPLVFLGLQIVAIGFAGYKCRKDWLVITLFSAFCVTYALYAYFIAAMALSDVWL